MSAGHVGWARNKLGRALHTLQDFYSHSNWVELGLGDSIGISQKLGVPSNGPELELPVAPVGFETCKNCTYPTSDIEQVQLDWIATCRRATIGDEPMSMLNKAMVATCQGISAFGPSIIMGTIGGLIPLVFPTSPRGRLLELASSILESLGLGQIYADCKDNLLPGLTATEPKYLTTGYFGTKTPLGATWQKGKCSHGGPFDRDARGREGIGKDSQHPFVSPHADLHKAAYQLADKATEKYLDDVTKAICGQQLAIDCGLLKTLYGFGPTLTFVIDTTGSMGGVIAAVRDSAIRIVNNVRDSKIDRPSLYVLVPFNDPDIPVATAHSNPDEFIKAISALRASGGDDCPELAMGGLASAVSATPAGGKVFLWTDAGAKDEANAAEVARAAKAKSIAIMVFKFANVCNSPAAFDLVAPGRFFDGIAGSEAASTASYAERLIKDDSVDLVRAIFALSALSPLLRRQSRTITLEVLVDDTISSVGFSVNASTVVMSITKPDGSAALPGDPGVSSLGLTTGSTIFVDNPTLGTWKVTVQGDDAFSFNSFAKTSLLLPAFNFVEPRGSHHEGLFPVLSPPAPGSTSFVVANIVGNVTSASFEFRSPGGALLSYLDLSRGNGTDGLTAPADLFYGLVTVPTTAFFVYVRGNTASGASFVRVMAGNLDLLFSGKTGGGGGNVTASTNSTTVSTSARFTNSTTYRHTPVSTTTMLCPTCQPAPCVTAVTSLIRFVSPENFSWSNTAAN